MFDLFKKMKTRRLIRKFLNSTEGYWNDHAHYKNKLFFNNMVDTVLENTEYVKQKKLEYKKDHRLTGFNEFGCPVCGYEEFPDNEPSFYLASNGQIYPQTFDYEYVSNLYFGSHTWKERLFCPICEEEFVIQNSDT